MADNNFYGGTIGSTSDEIRFWSEWTSFNKLFAQRFIRRFGNASSPNLVQISGGLDMIMMLNAYSYEMEDNWADPGTGE